MEVQPKHIFDDEKNWTAAGIWKPPSGFDPQKYQKRLDQIFGLSPSGESICRVRGRGNVKGGRTLNGMTLGMQ
jgi:hypothetical protein